MFRHTYVLFVAVVALLLPGSASGRVPHGADRGHNHQINHDRHHRRSPHRRVSGHQANTCTVVEYPSYERTCEDGDGEEITYYVTPEEQVAYEQEPNTTVTIEVAIEEE